MKKCLSVLLFIMPMIGMKKEWTKQEINEAKQNILARKTGNEIYNYYQPWIGDCPQGLRDFALGTCTSLILKEHKDAKLRAAGTNYLWQLYAITGFVVCGYVGLEVWHAYQGIDDDSVPLHKLPEVVALRAWDQIKMRPRGIANYVQDFYRKVTRR
jgi:hypothetical protein